MRVMIAAVGRLKSGPERDLAERYLKRAAQAGRSVGLTGFDVIEIRESRADNTARRMLEESIAIANVIPDRAVTVLMDERGESMPSAAFAGRLQAWRAEDKPAVVFVIGGADGLAPGAQGQIEPDDRLRRGDLAASAGAGDAAGAALPRRHDPLRAPVSQGVSAHAACRDRRAPRHANSTSVRRLQRTAEAPAERGGAAVAGRLVEHVEAP